MIRNIALITLCGGDRPRSVFPEPDSYGDRCDWYDRGDYSGKQSEADVQIRGAWTGAIGLVSVGRRRRTVAVVVTILTSGTDHSE
ncbi:MAG: hypothetical protein ABGZ17_30130, partial [Planctomycetaceae bacterium]